MFSSDGAYLMTGFVTATRSWRTTDWSPGPAGLSFPVGAEAPNELHNDAFSAARDLDAGFELSSADSLSLTLIGNATRAVKAPPAVLFSAVAVSHDGALVAAGAQDGRVLVYQPSDDFLLQLDDTPPAPRTFTHAAGRISVVAFSPDDRQLAAVGADGTLDMWRLSDGARIWSAAGVGGESDLYNAFLIAASADSGTLLVAPGDDNAVLLDATADVVKGRLSGPNAGAQVGDCAASPEATAMVCADSDRAWLLTPGNAAQPIGTSLAGAPRVRGGMALLPGGGGLLELVTPAGNDFGSDADLLAWPLGAGPARVVAHLGSLPNVLVVSGDGKVAAAPTDQFNGMRAWDLPDGTMRGSWLSPDTGIASLIGPMAISRQGEVLAGVGASRNITVARAGEPAARLLLQPGTASRLDTVALSSDGALVAAGTVFAEGASTDPAVFVLRVSDGQPLLGLPGTARRVAFFDDRTLVRGENDGTVTFWCLP
jgi:WD40 repeat protein